MWPSTIHIFSFSLSVRLSLIETTALCAPSSCLCLKSKNRPFLVLTCHFHRYHVGKLRTKKITSTFCRYTPPSVSYAYAYEFEREVKKARKSGDKTEMVVYFR